MDRATVKIRVIALLCALLFAAAILKPVYASESGNAVQQTPAAQQSAEPDPSIPLKVTAIDFGWEGWGDGTMIESNGECMLMDTFMPDCEDTLTARTLSRSSCWTTDTRSFPSISPIFTRIISAICAISCGTTASRSKRSICRMTRISGRRTTTTPTCSGGSTAWI